MRRQGCCRWCRRLWCHAAGRQQPAHHQQPPAHQPQPARARPCPHSCHSRPLLPCCLQDQKTAKSILDRWKEAGAESDPSQLRKLFLKQSLVPITASIVQVTRHAPGPRGLQLLRRHPYLHLSLRLPSLSLSPVPPPPPAPPLSLPLALPLSPAVPALSNTPPLCPCRPRAPPPRRAAAAAASCCLTRAPPTPSSCPPASSRSGQTFLGACRSCSCSTFWPSTLPSGCCLTSSRSRAC